jgi:hypothetical protein
MPENPGIIKLSGQIDLDKPLSGQKGEKARAIPGVFPA